MGKEIKIATIHSATVWPDGNINPEPMAYDMDLISQNREDNIGKVISYMHEAGKQGADLVCTHESFDAAGGGNMDYLRRDLYMSLIDEIPGPISDRLSEIARQYEMIIVANYPEKEGDHIYNTSVLINKKGDIAGKYRKIHLPPREKWSVSPGKEYTVIETDIGRIGFATCYDIAFQEHCRAMALNGADIIIHQTMGWGIVSSDSAGEAVLRTRAIDNCVYLVVAKNIQEINAAYGKSCVIDNRGNILAEAGGLEEKVVTAQFTPEFDRTETYQFNTLYSGVASTRARYLLEREPGAYGVICDKNPPIMDRYKDLQLACDTPELIRETYEKLEKYYEDLKQGRIVHEYHWRG